MKIISFYLEYPSDKERELATLENLSNHWGTVLALPVTEEAETGTGGSIQCYAQQIVTKKVGPCKVSLNYLQNGCLEIPEAVAREIHQELFTYLESI